MDRKELTRQYREHVPAMGVYQVRNTVTGHAVVAASRNLPAILNRHRAQLSLGAHPSPLLQQDLKAHGMDSFVFEVLDTLVPPEAPEYDPLPDLRVLEELWLDKLAVPYDRMHSIDPRRPR